MALLSCAVLLLLLPLAWAERKLPDHGGRLSDDDLEQIKQYVEENHHGYQVGRNAATERPMSELCGLVPPTDSDAIDKAAGAGNRPVAGTAVPTSWDWRPLLSRKNVDVPIRDQGQCGSCWAFAIVGQFDLLTTLASITARNPAVSDFSEQFLVSCSANFGYRYGCNGGSFDAQEVLKDIPARRGGMRGGARAETCYPYTATNDQCTGNCPAEKTLTSWQYIGGSIPSTQAIKEAIYNYGPVSVGVYVTSAFQAYKSGIFSGTCSAKSINHAVVLVGWDSQTDVKTGVTTEFWILRNSWGTGWGEAGYMRIKIGTCLVGAYANTITINGMNVRDVAQDAQATVAQAPAAETTSPLIWISLVTVGVVIVVGIVAGVLWYRHRRQRQMSEMILIGLNDAECNELTEHFSVSVTAAAAGLLAPCSTLSSASPL